MGGNRNGFKLACPEAIAVPRCDRSEHDPKAAGCAQSKAAAPRTVAFASAIGKKSPCRGAPVGESVPNVTVVGPRAEFDRNGPRMGEGVYALQVIGSATLRGEVGVTTHTT